MFYDIVIIGAGPCGLAAAARLREKTPTAIFTNDEHARFWKVHRQHHNSLEQELKRRKTSVDSGYGSENERDELNTPTIAVLDADSDQWMSQWKRRFADLQISHLRSPLFFHSDPADRDGLLAFVHEQNRADELREIPDVVGKELSKHEKKCRQNGKKKNVKIQHLKLDGRDGIDYYTPSTKLFDDYCDLVIKRYRLHNVVQQARVVDISYESDPPNMEHGIFTLKTDQNNILYSRIVIVATGPSQRPSVPNLHQLPLPARQHGSLKHVFDDEGTDLPEHVHEKLTKTCDSVNIIVVGGGLTSAQLVDLLLSRYPSEKQHRIKIHMLLRHSRLKYKPFDIDLPWISKTRNHLMSTFWSAETDAERLVMLQKARNGGSMTSFFAKKLQKHVNDGRLAIHYDTILTLDEECRWNDHGKLWTHLNLQGIRSAKGDPGDEEIPLLPGIDHIIFCTGISNSTNGFTKIPFLRTLQQNKPLQTIGPLPVLTEDLAWSDTIPCFFTGALAALRLGPGAGNLGGARLGAERIAWAVEEILADQWRTGKETGNKAEDIPIGRTAVPRDTKRTRKIVGNTPAAHMENILRDEPRHMHISKDRDEFTGSFSNQFAVLDLE